MLNTKHYLSKEKAKKLKDDLNYFINKGRKEIAQTLDDAKSLGDLKENAEYHQAREDQAKLESRILEIQNILKNAEIIKKNKCSFVVEIGSMVKIAKKSSSKIITYEIVGMEDADLIAGKIAFNAPLAQAMLSKKVGDIFDFKLPNNKIVIYRIIDIK